VAELSVNLSAGGEGGGQSTVDPPERKENEYGGEGKPSPKRILSLSPSSGGTPFSFKEIPESNEGKVTT